MSSPPKLAQKQILLTTQNGTFTGSLFTLDFSSENNKSKNATNNQQHPKGEASPQNESSKRENDEAKKNTATEKNLLDWIDEDDEGQENNKTKESENTAAVNGKVNEPESIDNNECDQKPSSSESKAGRENGKDETDQRNQKDDEQRQHKSVRKVYPPLIVLVPDLFSLPEPSFKPLAENLLRFGVTHTILVPHLRGFEPSSVQKNLVYSGYTFAELAVDLVKWMDEVVVTRKYVSSIAGAILVGHGFYGSLICEVANAIFWGRRELAIRSQVGKGFWSKKPSADGGFFSGKNQQDSNHQEEEEDLNEKLEKEQLLHSRMFLIRGLVFLNSAPPSNLIHQVSTYNKIILEHKSFQIFWFVFVFSFWLWITIFCPPAIVEKHVPTIIRNWWSAEKSNGKSKSNSLIRHLILGGTERWNRSQNQNNSQQQQLKNNNNNNQQQQDSAALSALASASITSDELCDNSYVSTILRSRSSPLGCCRRAVAAHVVCFASLFLRYGAQHDVWSMLTTLAEKRSKTIKNIVFETKQHQNKSLENASLMMLYQIARMRSGGGISESSEIPAWEEIAPMVPILVILPEDTSKNPLGIPVELQEKIVLEDQLCLKVDNNISSSSAKKVVASSSPCSTASLVKIVGADSYWMHENSTSSSSTSKQEEDDKEKKISSLCAFAIAKFARRGMVYESILEEKNEEIQKRRQEEELKKTEVEFEKAKKQEQELAISLSIKKQNQNNNNNETRKDLKSSKLKQK